MRVANTPNWQQYRRTSLFEMIPYESEMNLDDVSISQPDLYNGSPKQGDMIARNPKDHSDM